VAGPSIVYKEIAPVGNISMCENLGRTHGAFARNSSQFQPLRPTQVKLGNFNKAQMHRQWQGAASQLGGDSIDTFLTSLNKIKTQLAPKPKGRAEGADPAGAGGRPANHGNLRAGAAFKGGAEINEMPMEELIEAAAAWEYGEGPKQSHHVRVFDSRTKALQPGGANQRPQASIKTPSPISAVTGFTVPGSVGAGPARLSSVVFSNLASAHTVDGKAVT